MSLGPHAVTVLRPGAPTDDDYGNPVAGAPTQTVVAGCSVQPDTTTEVTSGRQVTVTGLRLWAPPDTDLRSTDRVVFAGQTYDVDGDVQEWDFDPLAHVEARLRRSEAG